MNFGRRTWASPEDVRAQWKQSWRHSWLSKQVSENITRKLWLNMTYTFTINYWCAGYTEAENPFTWIPGQRLIFSAEEEEKKGFLRPRTPFRVGYCCRTILSAEIRGSGSQSRNRGALSIWLHYQYNCESEWSHTYLVNWRGSSSGWKVIESV